MQKWPDISSLILDIKKDIFEVLTCNATIVITFGELKEERKMHHGGSYCYIHSHLQVKLIIQNLGFSYFQSLMNESNILNAWEYLRLSMNSVGCFSINIFCTCEVHLFFWYLCFSAWKSSNSYMYIERRKSNWNSFQTVSESSNSIETLLLIFFYKTIIKLFLILENQTNFFTAYLY